MQRSPEFYEKVENGLKEWLEEATTSQENWEKAIRSMNIAEEMKEWYINNSHYFKIGKRESVTHQGTI